MDVNINNVILTLDNILNMKQHIINLTNETSKINKIKMIPCIELYEFELKGYPTDNIPVKFNDFIDSPDFFTTNFITKKNESCGFIEGNIDQRKPFNKDHISSCDIITQKGGIFEFSEWYGYYKKWQAKTIFGDDSYKNTLAKNKNKIKSLILEATIINTKYILNNKPKTLNIDLDTESTHQGAFVFKINVKNSDRIIVFGDYHGSFHTFFRNMVRLHKIGVLDLNTYIINDNYKIIFLGDLVDRGEYGLEILMIICQLIIKNNKDNNIKIILNRGNHEEKETYANFGFYDSQYNVRSELMAKGLQDLEKNDNLFRNLFTVCSSAIIIENESNNRYWLSHGGFPIVHVDKDKIEECDVMEYNDNEKIWYHPYNAKSKINDIEITKPEQIRWNDFEYNETLSATLNYDRRIGFKLHNKVVTKFLEQNNIQFVIRAHQDSIGNSWILSSKNQMFFNKNIIKNEYYVINKIIDNVNTNGIFINRNEYKDASRNAVTGPIGRIRLDGLDWKNGLEISDAYDPTQIKRTIYPVLTLSTNTDMGRPLIHDSFAIIRFDLTEDLLNNFDKNINILDIRKDNIKMPI